ncbi:MAG: hypothetical protein JWO53_306, partial [Chlamydiia bacterium]|nr:hypothetical protein [Chlamydiia bacterium]
RNWTKADRSKFDDDFKNVVSIFLNKKGIGTIASPAIKAKDSDLKKAVALISKFPPDSLQGEAVQEDILKLIEKLITANPTTLKIESSSCQDAYELFCKLTTANKIKVLKYGLITTIKEGLAKKDSAKLDEIMTSICKNELLSGNTDILRGSAFLYLRTLSSEQIESLIEVTISSRYKETEAMKHAGDCLLSYYNKNTEPYSLIHRLLFNQVKNLPTLQSRSNSVPQSLSEAIHTHIHNRLKTSKDSILFIQEAVAYIANLAGNEAKEKVIEWKYDFLLYLSENGVGHDAPTRKFIEALSQDDKSSFIKRLDPLIAAEEEKRNSCLREEFNKKSVLDTRILNYKHVRKLLKG